MKYAITELLSPSPENSAFLTFSKNKRGTIVNTRYDYKTVTHRIKWSDNYTTSAVSELLWCTVNKPSPWIYMYVSFLVQITNGSNVTKGS